METKEKMSKEVVFYNELEDIEKKFLRKCKGFKEYILNNLILYLKKEIVFREKLIEEKENLSEKEEREDFSVKEYISYSNYLDLEELIDETEEIVDVIPYSMLVSLVSSFDYFLLSILEKISNNKEGVARFQNTKINYEEIESCSSLKGVKEYYTKKYLDELFRKSHDEIFEEIKNKFNVADIKDFSEYKKLLFIAEIRNIIVHNDGCKSVQFKNTLAKYGLKEIKTSIKFDKKGKVELDAKSILKILELIQIVSLKLFYKFVKHYFPNEDKVKEKCESFLNNISLRRYKENHPEIGLEIFGLLLSTATNSDDKFMYIINKAMCIKSIGKEDYKYLIESTNWIGASNRFLIAKSLLLDDFTTALEYIKNEDKREAEFIFREWPLCHRLVKTDEFKHYYFETYGIEYESYRKVWTATDKEYNERRKNKKV